VFFLYERESRVVLLYYRRCMSYLFFFQAEDGIRVFHVTGVQTCALPICPVALPPLFGEKLQCDRLRPRFVDVVSRKAPGLAGKEIGRASCRKSVDLGGRRSIDKKNVKQKYSYLKI